MLIKSKLFYLFLLILCMSNVAIAQEDESQVQYVSQEQFDAYVEVDAAYKAWDTARSHVILLLVHRSNIKSELGDARTALEDNNEDYRDGIVNVIKGFISVDPVDIVGEVAGDLALLVLDVHDGMSLNTKVEKAEAALEHIQSILDEYQTHETTTKAYYDEKEEEYEEEYGDFTTGVILQVTPNFCSRGDACTKKASSDSQNPEAHQIACPHRIDGWFFGVGTRNCTGYIYSCDNTFQCPNWRNHLQTGACGHTYKNSDINKHKMIMAGPCGHDYYACNKSHNKPQSVGCGHTYFPCIPGDGEKHWWHKCTYCGKSYRKCNSHIINGTSPCRGSSSGHNLVLYASY